MNNRSVNIHFFWLLPVVVLLLISSGAQGQQEDGKKKNQITLEGKVTGPQGNPIEGIQVSANEGTYIDYTDQKGLYSVVAAKGSFVLFESEQYKDYVLNLSKTPDLRNIQLEKIPFYTGEKSRVRLPQLIETDQRSLVGAVSRIKSEKLELYPTELLSNSLQGHGMGLTAIMNAGGMANNPPSLYLRGLSANSNNQLITVVDGIERPIEDLIPEEIESIELLKDPTAKILMGSRAANGVLMVTTERGEKYKKNIRTSVSYGVGSPTRLPQFLNSYDYARLYNEARRNDGIAPLYSESDLQGYQNSSGPNDLRYPDVDYYDYFLKNYNTLKKATAGFSGGNQSVQYSAILGYTGYDGLQEYGQKPNNNRFNARGNIDLSITDAVSAYMGIGTIIEYWKIGGINHAETFARLSSHRPNEYPLTLQHPGLDELNSDNEQDQVYYGASYDRHGNVLMALSKGGNRSNEFITSQMNFGMDFDLSQFVEGLSASSFITFDNYFSGEKWLDRHEATYEQQWYKTPSGQDTVVFDKVMQEYVNNSYNLPISQTTRDQGINAKLNYSRQLGNHNIHSDLVFFYTKKDVVGSGSQVPQDIKNTNTFLRTHYNYSNKYYAELTVSAMGSNRFAPGNRTFISHALGGSWILSEESFMESLDAFDFLKLKASWGVLGYDATTPHLLYNKRWRDAGNVQFGERNSGYTAQRVILDGVGSPNLKWEKSEELNFGVEGLALDQRLSFEFNYFSENRYDIIEKVQSRYSSIYAGMFPYDNWGDIQNRGLEGQLHWQSSLGNLKYRVGGNFIWSKNEVVRVDEIAFPNTRSTEGLPSDVIMGYENLGLFGKDVSLEGHPQQTFGDYQQGDLAYRDVNNDGMVDDLDRTNIGNSHPRLTYGIDVELKYKGFGLYVLASGASDVNMVNQNAYYTNYGIGKYSQLAMERYHPTNNPDGTQPRLTSTQASNNMVQSDFWMLNTSYFRLKNVELSYTFRNAPNAKARNLKFYIRGTNLMVLSDMEDLDPEVPNGGVTNYPVFTNMLAGVEVSF